MEVYVIAILFIVEDEELLHKLYTVMLTQAGHRVIGVAFNGAEAIAKLQQLKPPSHLVVIMDYRMPVMDGITATRLLKRLLPACKILFVSADESVKNKILQDGADFFLTKPFRSQKLLAVVQELTKRT